VNGNKQSSSKTVIQRGRQMGKTEQMRQEIGQHRCSGGRIDEIGSALRPGGVGRRVRPKIEG
jgi:hypothetical protein